MALFFQYPLAAGPQAKKWDKEPATVLGLTLGGPFNESTMELCPQGWAFDMGDKMCLRKGYMPEYGVLEVDGRPNLGFGYRLYVTLKEALLTEISITGQYREWDAIKDVLIEKYGPPHKIENEKVTNLNGAVFMSERLSWDGKKVSIMASARTTDLNTVSVMFFDNANLKRAVESDRQRAKGAASKL
jgi:hypothetical protein